MHSWYDRLLKTDFASFIGKTLATVDPGAEYLPNWHIDLIAEYLEAVRRAQITRLIINMPPRSLKSICVSVAWPAWLLGHAPQSRIIAASYASSLSTKHSLDCRLVLQSRWYRRAFPEVALVRGQNEKHKFMTSERGFRLATSVGGSVTGEGGNYLILDDPLNPAQALNARRRSYANDWFNHTFASRLNDKQNGAILLVMQRLHEHDLSGYLLEKGGWEHLSLPAIATRTMHYHFGNIQKIREEGEVLHEKRESLTLIERAKNELGSTVFAAQYQQQPLVEDNGLLRPHWFGRFKSEPAAIERRVQSWDTAIKNQDKHDASVCLTFAESNGRSYLLDARVFRYEYPELKRVFYAQAEQWQPDIILLEDRASGQQLLQDAKKETHLPLMGIQPKGDKLTRFLNVLPMIEAGRLMLPEHAPWLADFESELLGFPKGTHDDQVDALTQYLNWLKQRVWEQLRIRRI